MDGGGEKEEEEELAAWSDCCVSKMSCSFCILSGIDIYPEVDIRS